MASDVLTRTPPRADHRIPYGSGEHHFGDLWMPQLHPGQRAPVLVFLHGGWWKAEYGLDYGGHLCSALRAGGYAVWSIEYRRVGHAGGGWPGTFEDAAAGYDFLQMLNKMYLLDLTRVVAIGHSAGGHLAFWLAGRPHIPVSSVLGHLRTMAPLRAVIGLAGAVDLRLTMDLSDCLAAAHVKQEVLRYIGASPQDAPERYRAGDPGELVPLNIPQYLLQGTDDDQIPPLLPARWADRARCMDDPVTVSMIEGADHLDVVDPLSKAWPAVVATIRKAVG